MALALKDRVKETTIVVGTGTATLLGSSIGFQPFSVVGNGNTTYYCISDQFGSNWEVGIGTYSTSGNTLARTTVLASSNGGALVVFTAGIKDVFVTYPAEKGVWLDASNNAIGLGTPAAFVGTNITGTASGLTAGNVTTNANLTGAVTSTGNATSLGSFTSAQLALAISDETGTGKAVFATNPTLTSPTYVGTLTGSTDILNIGSGQLYKDAGGNVGIGTSSPAVKLEVKGVSNAEAKISTDSNAYAYLTLNTWALDRAQLRAEAANPGAGSGTGSGALSFWTANNSALAERMRIDASGNVGIGTSSGSGTAKLHVVSTSSTAYGLISQTPVVGLVGGNTVNMAYFANSRGVANDGLRFINYRDSTGSGTGNWETESYAIERNIDNVAPQASVRFGTNYLRLDTAGVERMRIDSSGGLILAGSTAQKATGTTWSNPSDSRLKDNVVLYTKGLNELMQVTVKEWEYNGKGGTSKGLKGLGVIADEVMLILPNTVENYKAKLNEYDKEDSDIKKFDATEITWLMLKSIQELKAIIDTQQEQINSLLGK